MERACTHLRIDESHQDATLRHSLHSPWTEEAEGYHNDTDQENHEKDKRKSRGPLNVFRSLASSSSTRHQLNDDEQQSNGNSSIGSSSRTKLTSQEKKSRAMSPSLPIYKNPPVASAQAETLRRKLISPPPPTHSPSGSPIDLRLGLAKKTTEGTTSRLHPPLEGQEPLKPDITKPLAVRKPLSFGPAEDDGSDNHSESLQKYTGFRKETTGSLRVPLIVTASSVSPSEEAPARAVLNWKAEGEVSEEGSAMDDEVFEEELNGECVCPDCELKMTAALAECEWARHCRCEDCRLTTLISAYEPPWTRSARKKYLADRRQAQIEGMRKRNSGQPTLTAKESEGQTETPTTVREIKADEVDSKMGSTKVEVVPILADPAAGKTGPNGVTDAILKQELEQEAGIRKEEERVRKSKSEAKRLSNDFSSGLYTGGGGARAMMRQLEEADRQEKRASIQRSRSPPIIAEAHKEEVRTMGAVKDTIVRPFTSPRRLSDGALPASKAFPRTPSPQLQQQQNQKKAVLPSSEELAKAMKREHRLSAPSMLIRRELSLGIPIHANSPTPKSSWPAHPPTRAMSPRLTSPTTLEDIAEVPSRTITEMGSGNSTPRRANTIGHSSPLARSGNNRRTPVSTSNGDAKVKRASSLTKAPLYSQAGQGNGLGLNLTHHAQSNDRRTGAQPKNKTRITFKDLVARIKS